MNKMKIIDRYPDGHISKIKIRKKVFDVRKYSAEEYGEHFDDPFQAYPNVLRFITKYEEVIRKAYNNEDFEIEWDEYSEIHGQGVMRGRVHFREPVSVYGDFPTLGGSVRIRSFEEFEKHMRRYGFQKLIDLNGEGIYMDTSIEAINLVNWMPEFADDEDWSYIAYMRAGAHASF